MIFPWSNKTNATKTPGHQVSQNHASLQIILREAWCPGAFVAKKIYFNLINRLVVVWVPTDTRHR